MPQRPWMPLYIADYLAKTTHLSAIESGAYLHLIMHYWQHGYLPDDPRKLAAIAKLTMREWRRYRDTLAEFFHNGWQHKRIDEELAKAVDISTKRRASAMQKHIKSKAFAMQMDTHFTQYTTSSSFTEPRDPPSGDNVDNPPPPPQAPPAPADRLQAVAREASKPRTGRVSTPYLDALMAAKRFR